MARLPRDHPQGLGVSRRGGSTTGSAGLRNINEANDTREEDGVEEDGALVRSVVAMKLSEKKPESKHDVVVATIQSWVKNHLFRKVKFTVGDADLDYSLKEGTICKQLLDYLSIDGEDGVNFWNRYRILVQATQFVSGSV